MKVTIQLMLALACLGALHSHAATRTSTNYSMTAETLDGGGAAASSANYSSVSSVEVTTTGISSSTYHDLRHGFIHGPENRPPIATDDTFAIDEDTTLVVAAPGVLVSDMDPDGDELTVTLAGGTSHGTLTLHADGSFSYTPGPDFNASDSFTYVARDSCLASEPATVNIAVRAINDPPVALAQSIGTNEDVPFNGTLTGTDVDGDALVFMKVSDPSHGLVTVNPDATFAYLPAANFYGEDSFSFVANDGIADSTEASVHILIEPVNDAPVMTLSGTSQSVQYSDSMADLTITVKDIDSDVSSLTLSALELPDDLNLSPGGFWTLDGISTASWTLSGQVLASAGAYEINFTARDGTADNDSQTYTLTVSPEGAVVYFEEANPVAQPVTAPGGNSGSFSMTFYVVEAWPDQPDDGSQQHGDLAKITGADVTVSLVPVGQGSSVSGACSLQPVASTGYDQVLEVQCDFDDVPVNTYTFQVDVKGDYFNGTGEDTLVVYDPSLGYTTGGGSFFWPDTQIADESGNVVYRGDRTTIGYTMKYNNQGTKVQGGFKAVRHLADGTSHRIKSNALYGLAVSTTKDPYGWASFAGKTTYQAPDWLEPEGNYEFLVYVEDWRDPSENDAPSDRAWFEVQDKDGNVVMDFSLPRAQDGSSVVYPEPLFTGNIVAPRTRK